MSDEPTLGELSRRLDRMEQRLDADRRSADARHLDAQLYAAERNHMQTQIADTRADLSAAVSDLKNQTKEIKNRLTWAFRAAVTGIAFPLAVLVVGWIITQGQPR